MQFHASELTHKRLPTTGDVVVFRNGQPFKVAEGPSGWYLVDKKGKINGAVGRHKSQLTLLHLLQNEGLRSSY